MPSGMARDSAFRKGGDAGTENPTTDEALAESKGWEIDVADFDDSFMARDLNSGSCSGVDGISLVSGSAHGETIS